MSENTLKEKLKDWISKSDKMNVKDDNEMSSLINTLKKKVQEYVESNSENKEEIINQIKKELPDEKELNSMLKTAKTQQKKNLMKIGRLLKIVKIQKQK